MLDYIITYNLPPRPINPALSGPWLSFSFSFHILLFSDLKFTVLSDLRRGQIWRSPDSFVFLKLEKGI